MSNNWQDDLKPSARAFLDLAWPVIGPMIDGGEYIPVEESKEPVADFLDKEVGIDGFQVIRDIFCCRSIACRMQPTHRPWNTFTIRYSRTTGAKTEYEKRRAACVNKWGDWMKPTYTIQGYYHPENYSLLSVGCVRTFDLFCFLPIELAKLAAGEKTSIYFQDNTQDGNVFIVVPWSALQSAGIPIYVATGDSADQRRIAA